MKKILFILLMILTINVYAIAPQVLVNGGEADIYEEGFTDGVTGVSYDNTTNTLTLDGYNGKLIELIDFDGETVSIVVKGTNTIYNEVPGENPGIAIYNTDSVNVNITGDDGAEIIFDACQTGIVSLKGNITIDNVDMKAISPDNTIIYLHNGDLTVKNSEIEVNDSNLNGINVDMGSITLDHVVYTSNSSDADVIIGNSGNYVITIKNSEFNIEGNTNTAIIGPEIKVYNSTFDIKNSNTLFRSVDANTYIEGSTINVENIEGVVIALSEIILKGSHINGDVISGIFDSGDTSSIISSTVDVEGEDFVGFYGLTVETTDSDIKLDGCDVAFRGAGIILNNSNVDVKNCGNPLGGPGLASAVGLELNDSTVKCVTKGFGVLLNLLFVDNSNLSIESTNSLPAIVVAPVIETEFDSIIGITNATVRETNLIKDSTYLDSDFMNYEGYAYSFAKGKLADNYDDSTIADLFETVASTIHIDAIKNPKTGDSLSYYITLMILSIMTITSCYYVLNKE